MDTSPSAPTPFEDKPPFSDDPHDSNYSESVPASQHAKITPSQRINYGEQFLQAPKKHIDKATKDLAEGCCVVTNTPGFYCVQYAHLLPTFADAAGMADLITQSGVKYNLVVLVYNKYLNNIPYEVATVEVKGEEALKKSNSFKVYENEDDTTKDLAEFLLANAIYAALVKAHTCEQSARQTAMDNASKNAKEMIGLLQMKYNHGRQAAIMNKLVDIITGASAI